MDFKWLLYVATLSVPMTHATTPSEQYHTLKNNISKLFVPKSSDEFKVAQMQKLSNFSVDASLGSDLPVVGSGRP
ncbi:outer membrane protein LapE [Acinetobacter genomosp. 15BJ]|uniref:Outer membrane protein LapE n=2 Tax=Acinetobacter TaxID=469 RepID=R9B2Y3_9GAMM|nr:outer membrane protein LapE [Acinetobacter genomosp. 15BJ]